MLISSHALLDATGALPNNKHCWHSSRVLCGIVITLCNCVFFDLAGNWERQVQPRFPLYREESQSQRGKPLGPGHSASEWRSRDSVFTPHRVPGTGLWDRHVSVSFYCSDAEPPNLDGQDPTASLSCDDPAPVPHAAHLLPCLCSNTCHMALTSF